MSEFNCPVVRVTIVPHPNADAIEIAQVGDYQSIVRKGAFHSGDLAVYIPEQAVLPEWVAKRLQIEGKLAGSAKNRVKAVRLRGIFSQGLLFPLRRSSSVDATYWLDYPERPNGALAHVVQEGEDVAEFLDIVKYEPEIPVHMAGRTIGADLDITHKYDFENIKKNPALIEEGHPVVITEKIHGTLLQVVVVPTSKANEKFHASRVAITSKGLGGRGILLDHDDEANVYARAVKKYGLLDKMLERFGAWSDHDELPILLFGEVFGTGIQDLGYGAPLQFRAFDICVGVREDAEFLIDDTFENACRDMNIERVPVLYRGPFSREILDLHTNGKTTLGGDHIREGVVVKSAVGGRHERYGRKIAKSVSEAYLLRKDATEFN